MTTLEWWLLSTCTAAGLATVFRWHILAVFHLIRGPHHRRYALTRRDHKAFTSGPIVLETFGAYQRRVRRNERGQGPGYPVGYRGQEVVASAVIRNWPCGCEPWSDPG